MKHTNWQAMTSIEINMQQSGNGLAA